MKAFICLALAAMVAVSMSQTIISTSGLGLGLSPLGIRSTLGLNPLGLGYGNLGYGNLGLTRSIYDNRVLAAPAISTLGLGGLGTLQTVNALRANSLLLPESRVIGSPYGIGSSILGSSILGVPSSRIILKK